MPAMLRPPLLRPFASLVRLAGRVPGVFAAAAAAALVPGPAGGAPPESLAGSGVATVPADASFFCSALRIKEQYDAIVGSNAYARILGLPAVQRAFDSWEEQREMPGSPVSMFLTFLELPENEQAAELLADMVSTDTFLYGERSCVAFVKLLRMLGRVQNEAAAADLRRLQEWQGRELEQMDDEEDLEETEAAVDRLRIIPVAQVVEEDLEDLDEPPTASGPAAVLEALADNLDLIVVPDLVWGFKTSKRQAGEFQVQRLEVLARMLTEMNPALAGALKRTKVAGGEVVTFRLDGGLVPWDDLAAELAADLGGSADLDTVLDRIRGLDVVVGLGMIGDWVIISVGDSVDHLDKLVLPGREGESLIGTRPFAPLRAAAAERLTSVWYVSQEMAEAVAPEAEDLDPLVELIDAAVAGAVPAAAAEDVEERAARVRTEYAAMLPVPGPWLAYSSMTKDGYEGYAWDWSKNMPLDGGRELGLLAHAGGSPAAVAAFRSQPSAGFVAAVQGLAVAGWNAFKAAAVPQMNDVEQEKFEAFDEHVAPLGPKLAAVFSEKLGPAVGDYQMGLVLDSAATTTKPQRDLPASAEPLPLLEPAIVLPLADRALFVEGLNDLFALGDELVAAIRKVDPDAVPAGYEVPDPEKTKVEGGSVWSFAIPDAGLDEQVKPSIGVSDEVVALCLLPGHAARLLPTRTLETAKGLPAFATPLAAAAALDFPALVDVVEPWIVYVTRYGCAQQRDGMVDPAGELSAADENAEASEALEHVDVVLDAARCLKAAAAETATRDGAVVTHWRNLIQDLPKR